MSWNLDNVRRIVAECQAQWVDPETGDRVAKSKKGAVLLDLFTASMLVQVHDALSPANQEKFRGVSLRRAIGIGWQVTKGAKT